MKTSQLPTIISRQEAQELGLKRYFTGLPCKNGHISERTISEWKCIECKSMISSEYRKNNKSEISIKKKKEYLDNKDKIKGRSKLRYENNKEEINEKNKIYRMDKKHKIAENNKAYRIENSEILKIKKHKYYLKNKVELNKKTNMYTKEFRKTPKGKLSSFVRKSVKRIILIIKQEKNINSIKAIPYTIEDFKKHIENQFDIMMTWKNHGFFGWHIDHKVSLSSLVELHKDKSQEEILNIVNALDNLQPMWWRDNFKKGAR